MKQAPENHAYSNNTNSSARNEREAARQRIQAVTAARRYLTAPAPPLTVAQLATLTEAANLPTATPRHVELLGLYLYKCHRRDLVETGECPQNAHYFAAQSNVKREGVRLITLAAARGSATAQYEVFFIVLLGADGRGGDPREAYEWLDRAAEQGHAAALRKRENIINSAPKIRILYGVPPTATTTANQKGL